MGHCVKLRVPCDGASMHCQLNDRTYDDSRNSSCPDYLETEEEA
jgi:hypothetical protein